MFFLHLAKIVVSFCLPYCQVAYVLGQLQNKSASATLSRILKDVNEHPMVRHEAAEALGSIAGMSCINIMHLVTSSYCC